MTTESIFTAFWVLLGGVLVMRVYFSLRVRQAGERLMPDREAIEREGYQRAGLVPQDPDDEPASVLLERIRKEREAHSAKKQTRKSRSGTKEMQQLKLL